MAFCKKKNIPFFPFACIYAARYPSVGMHSHFEFRCIFTSIFFFFVVALSKINIRHGGDFLRFLTPHFRTRCQSSILGFFII